MAKGNGNNNKKKGPSGFLFGSDQATINSIGNYPWNAVVGDRITVSGDRVGGAISYPVVHCVGSTKAADTQNNQFLTRAADQFFQYYTQGFTASVDFEAPDIFMAQIAAASLAALFAEGKRAFGISRRYKQCNAYTAKAIVQSLGFDFSCFNGDEENSMSSFMSDFNIRVDSFNETIALVADTKLWQRWVEIASSVYSDNNQSVYNTLTNYVIEKCLKYSGFSANTGTCLVPKQVRNGQSQTMSSWTLTRSQYFSILDELLDALKGTDTQKMFGAIRRVYSQNELVQIEKLTLDYNVVISRDDLVSCSLHNADCFSTATFRVTEAGIFDSSEAIAAVYQTADGRIVSEPVALCPRGIIPNDETGKLIDSWALEVTAGNMLDMTVHCTPIVGYGTGTTAAESFVPVAPLTEMLLFPVMFIFDNSGDLVRYPVYTVVPYADRTNFFSSAFAAFSHVNSHTLISFLKPETEVIGVTTANKVADVDLLFGEIDFYTKVEYRSITRMHAKQLFYMVKMPKNSKSTTS